MAEPGTDAESTLGQMLRGRREARGLAQEQAAAEARVQLVFVRALEDDDYHLLPDEMYLARFVFEYATFLGLDPAAADAAFRQQLRRPPGPGPLYRAVPRLAALPWRRLLAVAAAVLALIPVVFILLSLAGREREAPAPTPASGGSGALGREGPSESPAPGGAGPVPAVGSAGVGQTPGPRPGQSGEPGTHHRHVLLVRARELTWLAVKADEGGEEEVLLREGESVRWEADRDFVLSIGNAGGAEVSLDGQPVLAGARRGEVIRRLRLPSPAVPSR